MAKETLDLTSRNLPEETLQALALPKEERIRQVRSSMWISYPRAMDILSRLEELLELPRVDRMPDLLIVGETNNGKTSILSHFKSLHPAVDAPGGEGIAIPFLTIQAPPGMDDYHFYGAILDALCAPYSPRDRAAKLINQVKKIFSRVNVGILAIDEIQHVLSGPVPKQRKVLDAIKHLGNELRIPIVAAGTPEARVAIHTNPQLANRFEPVFLPRWKLDKDFRRLLVTFERGLPLLKASNLADRDMAIRLHAMSEGLIGEVKMILTRAAVLAIQKEVEKVTPEVLDGLKWTTPSQRRSTASVEIGD